MADVQSLLLVTAPITASTTITAGRLTLADATNGTVTATLPTPTRNGVQIGVQKVDTTTNNVVISGNIDGANTTVALTGRYETRMYVATGATWRLVSSAKSKAQLDASYVAVGAAAGGALGGTYPNPSLAAVITPGTVGSANATPVITFNAAGQIVTATEAATSGSGGGTAAVDNGDGTINLGVVGTGVVTINTQTGTAYTIGLGDMGNTIRQNSTNILAVTVPTDANASIAVGSATELILSGTGSIVVAGAPGCTVNATNGAFRLTTQYATASLMKLGANDWLLSGNTVA